MIKSVFEAVDTDRSGKIDKYELQACIEKFNVQADPTFFKHVLREEGIKEDDELDFEMFEAFLVRFLQHQFYKKIESYVTNKGVFMQLGGRSVIYSHRGTILENKVKMI
jgi:Ca2+-binding EF-hand superfamily protein